MIRNIVACAAVVFVLSATPPFLRGQSQELGGRRFGPLYEEGRPAPATDDKGWPTDWDQRPHLSLDVFGFNREFSASRDYRRDPAFYGGSPAQAGGPYAPGVVGNDAGWPRGYDGQFQGPRAYGNGRASRDLFSSDSGFALRYGYPGDNSQQGFPGAPFGYPIPGPAYGFYPPPFGYGPGGMYPPYLGYGPGYWGGGTHFGPPGGYRPHFYW